MFLKLGIVFDNICGVGVPVKIHFDLARTELAILTALLLPPELPMVWPSSTINLYHSTFVISDKSILSFPSTLMGE